VEGPSGIGKSTAVAKALEDIGLDPDVTNSAPVYLQTSSTSTCSAN